MKDIVQVKVNLEFCVPPLTHRFLACSVPQRFLGRHEMVLVLIEATSSSTFEIFLGEFIQAFMKRPCIHIVSFLFKYLVLTGCLNFWDYL